MYKKASLLFTTMLFSFIVVKAQKVDSIYVHLYTDSLKKGTYNYINIDGLLSNGKYIPLDSTELSFSSSAGKFSGNNLWVAPDLKEEKITVHVILKKNNLIRKDFVMYIKKKEDGPLKTQEQLMEETKKKG